MNRQPNPFPAPPESSPPEPYRAFRLNRSGVVASAEVIGAHDGDEARAMASVLANGHGVELWQGARRLARFPPRRD